MYIDKLDDIVNKYNNTYHNTIKMKPFDVRSNTFFDSSKEVNVKILNLKLVILLQYQNMKMFLQMFTLQIGLKKFLWLKNLKMLCTWLMTYVINDLSGEEIFTKTNCQKETKKSLELKK